MTIQQAINQSINQPINQPAPLPPAQRFAVGTILTLRMRGHSRTNGQEYWAPAIVLQQYDNQTGDIEVLIWDSTAGTHYNNAYPTRDLTTSGDGNERRIKELQSNIGTVLFAPDEFSRVVTDLEGLMRRVMNLEKGLQSVIQARPDALPVPKIPSSEAKPK